MDAYDHIQSETLHTEAAHPSTEKPSSSNTTNPSQSATNAEPGNLSTDLKDAYRSFSASPWGAKLGGFLGSVRKQGESLYQGARDEASIASEEALKGFADLRDTIVNRTRSMSLGDGSATVAGERSTAEGTEEKKEDAEAVPKTQGGAEASTTETKAADPAKASSSQDTASAESEGLVARFRAEAAARLRDIQRAEDAADEALLKFGTNIRNFLREAVIVSAPPEDEAFALKAGPEGSKVLFESKDAEGKRVIHTTRFDAQMHVIHCSLDSFLEDPVSPEYAKWKEGFSVEGKTEEIAADLKKYEELRRAMEKLVPERVEYEEFWTRYYFLRMVIESEEKRRREMLKGAYTLCLPHKFVVLGEFANKLLGATLNPEVEVSWDEESDSEPSTPQQKPVAADTATPSTAATSNPEIETETETKSPPRPEPLSSSAATLEPLEHRKSQDQHSQSGSDASYDLVSGATSKTPSSPKEESGTKKPGERTVKEESDEEDWE
ncbi:MAG: hypothetical protein LQ340_001041 [Diploschistes diacapsis]|nr:MAG: hypothetical protein LQ340_001041 [Diploschistes diacapsis]